MSGRFRNTFVYCVEIHQRNTSFVLLLEFFFCFILVAMFYHQFCFISNLNFLFCLIFFSFFCIYMSCLSHIFDKFEKYLSLIINFFWYSSWSLCVTDIVNQIKLIAALLLKYLFSQYLLTNVFKNKIRLEVGVIDIPQKFKHKLTFQKRLDFSKSIKVNY